MEKLMRGSEVILVLLLTSKLGIVKVFSLREDTVRYLASGWAGSALSQTTTKPQRRWHCSPTKEYLPRLQSPTQTPAEERACLLRDTQC